MKLTVLVFSVRINVNRSPIPKLFVAKMEAITSLSSQHIKNEISVKEIEENGGRVLHVPGSTDHIAILETSESTNEPMLGVDVEGQFCLITATIDSSKTDMNIGHRILKGVHGYVAERFELLEEQVIQGDAEFAGIRIDFSFGDDPVAIEVLERLCKLGYRKSGDRTLFLTMEEASIVLEKEVIDVEFDSEASFYWH